MSTVLSLSLSRVVLHRQQHVRNLSTFAEIYRRSVSNALVRPGDPLVGHVVGSHAARQRFFVVDFGLKNEAPFASSEIPGASDIGARVALPLVQLEDEFNEPSLDHSRRSSLPALTAERLGLWLKMNSKDANLVHGRFATIKRGGAAIKALGTDAFAPRHHVVSLSKPVLGSFAPFYVLSMATPPTSKGTGGGTDLELQPVVSSYGGYLFALANLVGDDKAWKASGGGPDRERISYLRLLTRLLAAKNVAVRRILPRHENMPGKGGERVHRNRNHDGDRGNKYHDHRRGNPRYRREGAWLDGMQTVDGKREIVQLGGTATTKKTSK